jgi:hypothetical protein
VYDSSLHGSTDAEEATTDPANSRREVAATVRRPTGSEELAVAAASTLELEDLIELVPLDGERSRRDPEITATTGVRGADAVYLELEARGGVFHSVRDSCGTSEGSAGFVWHFRGQRFRGH